MTESRRRWLLREISVLRSEGLLDPETADRLRARYETPAASAGDSTLMTVFASLGAALIVLGLIVLAAVNWENLARPVRLLLAGIPLVSGYALAFYTLCRREGSAAWREASTIVCMTGFAACAALLSQIYHIPGSAESLALASAVVSLPVLYVLRSQAGTLLYLVVLTVWAVLAQTAGNPTFIYWPLFGALLPRLIHSFRHSPYSMATPFLSWLLILALTCGIGISLEKTVPGLWMLVYACFFAFLSLLSRSTFFGAGGDILKPFAVAGSLGLYVLSFMLTYSWPWHDIGWRHYRPTESGAGIAGMSDYAVLLIFVLLFASLAYRTVRRKDFRFMGDGFLAGVIVLCYVSLSTFDNDGVLIAVHLGMNLAILVAALFRMLWGFRHGSQGDTRLAVALVCVLVSLRFIFVEGFFEHMVVRGLIFIGVGIAFLSANVLLSRRNRKRSPL